MLGRDAVPPRPRTRRVDRHREDVGNSLRPRIVDDGLVTAHMEYVQYARTIGKCQLHAFAEYEGWMDSPATRLKQAREAAGFTSGREAALAMGISYATYAQHENGTRGFPASRAETYARRFRVSPEWLIYGKGPGPNGDPTPPPLYLEVRLPSEPSLAAMFETMLEGHEKLTRAGIAQRLAHDLPGALRRALGRLPSPMTDEATFAGAETQPLSKRRPEAQ